MPEPLWVPDSERIERAQITRFRRELEAAHGLDLSSYGQLHRWSVENLEAFWTAVWDFCELRGERAGPVLVDADHMPGARFFPDARLSFAENLLWRDDDAEALIFRGEDGTRRRLSWNELRAQVAVPLEAVRSGIVARRDRDRPVRIGLVARMRGRRRHVPLCPWRILDTCWRFMEKHHTPSGL